MGQSSSNLQKKYKEQQSELPVKGHWVSDIKTGMRWATDPIVSDESVIKKPLGNDIPGFENNNDLTMIRSLPQLPGEVWGPYRKKFTTSFVGGQVFTPPESVDDVPLLCRCRDIQSYMRDPKGGAMLQGFGAVAFGSKPPACWDDGERLWNMTGGMFYYVITRHPSFYIFGASKKGVFGIAEKVAKGPVGPVPLALGALAFMRGGKTLRNKYQKKQKKQRHQSKKQKR